MNLERMGYKERSLIKNINGSDGSIAGVAGRKIIVLAVSAQTDTVIGTSVDPHESMDTVKAYYNAGYTDSPVVFGVGETCFLEGDAKTYTVWYTYEEM